MTVHNADEPRLDLDGGTVTTTAASDVRQETLSSWYADFTEQGGRAGRGVNYIVGQAKVKAEQYRELGTAYDDFQPGNGTSYKLVLHDMVAPWVRNLVGTRLEHDDLLKLDPWERQLKGYVDREQMTEADLWQYAYQHTMAARAGGELLVSMPENGGRCCVLSVGPDALYVPDYIAGVLGVRLGDAVPLAVYLTAFVNAVAEQRTEVVASV